jgi:hypothetical protein
MHRALEQLDRACDLLISATPADWEASETILAAVIGDLRHASIGRGTMALQPAMQLRKAVHRAGRLLETAAAYRFEWARRLDIARNGYTAGGEPAPVPPAGTISLRG